jgi:hypothetical protein
MLLRDSNKHPDKTKSGTTTDKRSVSSKPSERKAHRNDANPQSYLHAPDVDIYGRSKYLLSNTKRYQATECLAGTKTGTNGHYKISVGAQLQDLPSSCGSWAALRQAHKHYRSQKSRVKWPEPDTKTPPAQHAAGALQMLHTKGSSATQAGQKRTVHTKVHRRSAGI